MDLLTKCNSPIALIVNQMCGFIRFGGAFFFISYLKEQVSRATLFYHLLRFHLEKV